MNQIFYSCYDLGEIGLPSVHLAAGKCSWSLKWTRSVANNYTIRLVLSKRWWITVLVGHRCVADPLQNQILNTLQSLPVPSHQAPFLFWPWPSLVLPRYQPTKVVPNFYSKRAPWRDSRVWWLVHFIQAWAFWGRVRVEGQPGHAYCSAWGLQSASRGLCLPVRQSWWHAFSSGIQINSIE